MTDQDEQEPIVIIRAAVCGHHHAPGCRGCASSQQMNDEQLDQMRDRIEALSSECEALKEALSGIKWKSADRDNMEFRAAITCWQMDAIRAALSLRTEKATEHE